MSAPRLTEASVNLVLNYIKTNIATALAAVRADRPDAKVATDPPQSYFIYPRAHGYKTPAIFVIAEEMDFKLYENQANFIDALVRINVAVLVEDRNRDLLTLKAWRYQSALHDLLAQRPLTSIDNKVKLDVTVTKASYSPIYTAAKNEEDPEAVFRAEVLFECEVYHRENY